MSRLVKLEVSNVKRIKWASIDFEGNLVTIGGLNAQGKSTLLDCIQMLYGPGRAIPAEPVHKGQTKGYIRGTEDSGVVTELRFTPSGASKKVMDPRQGQLPSPQSVCDRKAPAIAFDPLAWSRMKPADQVEVLKQLAGLDFAPFDTEAQMVYEERTSINREIKSLQSRVSASPRHADVPKAEVSVAELAKELQDKQGANESLRRDREAVEKLDGEISGIEDEIAELQKKLSAKQDERVKAAKVVGSRAEHDVSALQHQIETAEADNRRFREAKALSELEADLAIQEENERALTARLEEIKAEKAAAIASAKMPLAGLGFDENGPTFNGVPLTQCSSAELVNISASIGFSLVPEEDKEKLRIMLVREGSLLDRNSLKKLAEMAEAHGWLVLVEVVGEDGDVVMTDGNAVPASREVSAP